MAGSYHPCASNSQRWRAHIIPVLAIAKALLPHRYTPPLSDRRFWYNILSSPRIDRRQVPESRRNMAAKKDDPTRTSANRLNIENGFIRPIPETHRALQVALADVEQMNPERKIAVISGSTVHDTLPSILKAPGQRAAGYIHVGISPIMLSSRVVPAFGPALPYNSSSERRERNIAMHEGNRAFFST
jgi:hypothetical protein